MFLEHSIAIKCKQKGGPSWKNDVWMQRQIIASSKPNRLEDAKIINMSGRGVSQGLMEKSLG